MALKVIKVSRVSPATDSIAPLILPLTFFDLMWLNFYPVERVTFYRHTELSHDSFYSLILPKLEESLRLALSHFLPLSGHLKWDPQVPKPHIFIFPQDIVSLTVAETTDADFSRVSGKGLRHQTELRPLVPKLPVSSDSLAILALQITLFPDQGFCIGISVNHAAVDGETLVKFLKTWAHICKYGVIPQDFHLPVLLDRTVINLPAELERKILEFPPYNGSVRPACSFELLRLSGYKAKTFLGENGFVNGVNILSDSVRGLSSRGVESVWELYEEGLKAMELGVRRLVVGGSNKFGIYGSDFGWGRPVNTENISLARSILFTMSETRDETGGVEIGICLKKCEMDVFVSVFLNGLPN
ncbi:unnamed protein product [Eruca vesicaria subsp. sativa]|uniref:Uncharacterized protein n=1 Tax=Eruca vesicaria subsp. sativa TaxID=29727 RepID=A0ABC8JUM9_ERUVS|nr:unnamed protein product [Eruca vesicaria subsp. sativa]